MCDVRKPRKNISLHGQKLLNLTKTNRTLFSVLNASLALTYHETKH